MQFWFLIFACEETFIGPQPVLNNDKLFTPTLNVFGVLNVAHKSMAIIINMTVINRIYYCTKEILIYYNKHNINVTCVFQAQCCDYVSKHLPKEMRK